MGILPGDHRPIYGPFEDTQNRETAKESIASFIGSTKRKYCNSCRQQLLPDGTCGKCGILYLANQPMHEIRIKALDGKRPGHQPSQDFLTAKDSEEWNKPKDRSQPNLDPLFKTLEKVGFKFTSYSRTDE
jgi:hypothetical protein